jgi:hypothetical protein
VNPRSRNSRAIGMPILPSPITPMLRISFMGRPYLLLRFSL